MNGVEHELVVLDAQGVRGDAEAAERDGDIVEMQVAVFIREAAADALKRDAPVLAGPRREGARRYGFLGRALRFDGEIHLDAAVQAALGQRDARVEIRAVAVEMVDARVEVVIPVGRQIPVVDVGRDIAEREQRILIVDAAVDIREVECRDVELVHMHRARADGVGHRAREVRGERHLVVDVHAEAQRRRIDLVEHERKVTRRLRLAGEIDLAVQRDGIADHRAAEAADGKRELHILVGIAVHGNLDVIHEVMAVAVKDLHAAVVGVELDADAPAGPVEILPVLLHLLLALLAAPVADGAALLLVERIEADLVAPVVVIGVPDLVEVGRRPHEIHLHLVVEVDGDGGVVDVEFLDGRRFEVLRQDIPDIDAEIAARDREDGVAVRVVPGKIVEVDVARDIGDHAVDGDRAAQHILVLHGAVEDHGRAAREDLKENEQQGDEREQQQAGAAQPAFPPQRQQRTGAAGEKRQ